MTGTSDNNKSVSEPKILYGVAASPGIKVARVMVFKRKTRRAGRFHLPSNQIEREVERLGGKQVKQLDVRIIATSNRNMAECVADGTFREDLFYRLSVVPLQWQPLRDRRADIVPIAERLLANHDARALLSPPYRGLLLNAPS